jgi:2-methylcitrate dehydratase PrpD
MPDFAAFANGTLAETLDFQDSNTIVLTHNGTAIIPAALAPGEAPAGPLGDRRGGDACGTSSACAPSR